MRRAFVLAVLALGCPQHDDAPAPAASSAFSRREVAATRGTISDRVLLTGQLEAASAVAFTVPKTEIWQLTIRWMAEDGAAVKAGDKVLEFDNSQFTNGLNQKHLQLLESSSSLRAFRDLAAMSTSVKRFELQQHEVALDKATLLASVPPDLQPLRTTQERQLEKQRAEDAVAGARKELETEQRASALEARVKQIELDKARRAIESAEQAIAELELEAPRDGVVLIGTHPWEGRRFQIGDTVQPGFTIVTLPDLAQAMKVSAELSDVDDGRVTVGRSGTCTLDAYPREPIACEVEELAPVAQRDNPESLRRIFRVKLSLAASDPARMRPGMSVKVELAAGPPGSGPTGIVVPRGTLSEPGDGPPRVRLAGGELREVVLGACDAQRCLVERGVSDGELLLEGP